jgi:hypothetical protein
LNWNKTVLPGEHVVHDIEEDVRDNDLVEDDTKLDLLSEELEEAERHVED